MPFQILTSQWTKIITYKFRVTYDEFNNASNTRLNKLLKTIPKNRDIMGAKVWLRETFAAPLLTSCNLYIIPGTAFATTNENAVSPVNIPCLSGTSDSSGQIGFGRVRMGDMFADNQLGARIVTNSIPGGAQFTAGEVDIWIFVVSLP